MNPSIFTRMPKNDCLLKQERIDIWQFSLTELPEMAVALLNDEEQQRAHRFIFPKHQRRFSVARAMTKAILARYLDERPQDLLFSYNDYGKPTVINTQTLEFNLSHSGDLALLAVGQQFPMGVDLEFFSARPYEGIGKSLFSNSELRGFLSLPARIKPLSFFHIWAQKEAVIKACGMGLSYPTQQFSVPVLPPGQAKTFDSLHNKYWQLASFMPTLACAGALCYETSVTSLRKINLQNLKSFLQ